MPIRVIFRCHGCDAIPDPLTQLSLERGLRELAFGEYLDVAPGHWLLWLGGGPLGPRRYACPEHRGDLVADLREHYGTIAPHPWKRPPYPARCARPTPNARSATAVCRRCRSGGSRRERRSRATAAAADDPLARLVAAPGGRERGSKPFGAFTLADVRARAAELSSVVGFGTARVAGVARGWSELARAMEATGAATVADLGPERCAEFARKLWVVPPGGSLL